MNATAKLISVTILETLFRVAAGVENMVPLLVEDGIYE